tara:strand:+ start:567 stop:1409 length:843 start_codon:yes stop_codon:yes gene_type:complete
MQTQVAYLGPQGSYAESAAHQLINTTEIKQPLLLPFNSLISVIENVANDKCPFAVVPIENSVEGGVTATLDALWEYRDLFIVKAIVMPIQHSLIGSGEIENISEVLSHPQALAQCSKWLNKNIPNALTLPTNSTSEAARMVSGSSFRAAIGSRSLIESNDLKELFFPINDSPGNCTRFVLLSKSEFKDKANLASCAFSLLNNSPGALLNALSCFGELKLNMSRIESRPSKRELGEYIFFIDVELSKNQTSDYEKLKEKLRNYCEHIVDFGCYATNKTNEI